MCGICGIINKSGEKVNEDLLWQMLLIIHHRGPDAEGMWLQGNLAIGHKRLSIIDLSDAGKQPMHYLDRYSIVYNGEIYNYLELRKELLEKNYSFHTGTDTEVIMAVYDCWGEECLNKFNGMWAFALYDRVKKTLFCARDRFGIKPLYYVECEEMFIFASEIKQILEIMPDAAKMNEDRVWDFLCNGIMEKGETTFFKEVKQLSAGMCGNYSLKTNQWSVRKWYELKKHKKVKSYKREVKTFKDIFLDSVRLRLRADVPIGSCLSGGLDSSAIVCSISKLSTHKMEIHTSSSCFNNEQEKKYDEQEYIDDVVKNTSAVSHKVYLDCEDMFRKLDEIIWHMDEPFTTTSICAQWVVFEEAKRNQLTVMLDGQGSDEQLAGYTSFYVPAVINFIKRGELIQLYRTMKGFDNTRGKAEMLCAKDILQSALKNMFCNFRLYRKGILALGHFWGRKKKSGQSVRQTVPYPYPMDKASANSFFNAQHFDMFTKDMIQINLPALLHFEDRNSMAHSYRNEGSFFRLQISRSSL